MTVMAPRPSTAGEAEPVTAQAPTPEPAALGRGDRVTLQASIVRFQGPYVQVQVLGELVNVLRSTLEKEIARP